VSCRSVASASSSRPRELSARRSSPPDLNPYRRPETVRRRKLLPGWMAAPVGVSSRCPDIERRGCHGYRRDHLYLCHVLPGPGTPADPEQLTAVSTGRSGAVYVGGHASADAVSGRSAASARPAAYRGAAVPAHHRPRRGGRLLAPDRVPDARLVVTWRLRRRAEPALGP